MSFQALLADLEAFSGSQNEGDDVAKSLAEGGEAAAAEGAEGDDDDAGGDADDAAITAAAAEGEAAGDDADADADGDAGGDEPLGKSMTVIDENGDEQEAIDATDLIKSLVDRVELSETNMGKAVGLLTDLVKSQAATLGTLRSEVSRLGSAGRGRKAVISVAEKPGAADLTKSDPADEGGITSKDFMAKAMDACTAGKITGLEIARCESYLNRGLDVPANIKTKVLG